MNKPVEHERLTSKYPVCERVFFLSVINSYGFYEFHFMRFAVAAYLLFVRLYISFLPGIWFQSFATDIYK